MRRLALLFSLLLLVAASAEAQWISGSTSGGGVTSIIAGTGISVNQATGAVTVTNTGASGLTASGPPAIHQVPLWTTATDLTGLAVGATTGMFLRNVAASDPVWSTLVLPNAGTQYDIPLVTATNTWGYDTGKLTYNVSTGTLGAPAFATTGTASGSIALSGSSSGTATITVGAAAGSPTITLGTNSGTPVVTASSPLGITTATGNITCATCTTSAASLTSGQGLFGSGTQGMADLATEIAAPGTPAAGKGVTWADSTDHRLHDKNPSGTIGTTVVADAGSSNNFLTAISAAGVISKAQPSYSNLSGTLALASAVFANQGTTTTVLHGNASGNPAFGAIVGADMTAGTVTSTQLAAPNKKWKCVVAVGDPGAASAVLAADNDSPVACSNDLGADVTIETVACWADPGTTGTTSVTPILTGGSATSVLTGALTCGDGAWAAGAVQGTAPVLHSFSSTGATCSSTPCTIDVNLTAVDGATKYLVVKITGTY
jgi:hypothetical protein